MIKKSFGGRLWRGLVRKRVFEWESIDRMRFLALVETLHLAVASGGGMQMAVDKSFARWNEGTKRGINVIEPPVPLVGPLEFRGGNQLVVYENDLEEIGSKYPLRQRLELAA